MNISTSGSFLPLQFLRTAIVCFGVFAASLDAQETETQWYKGNLHTHSLWSDGNDFPDMIVRWYVEHDYQFLALTDHNVLSNGEKWRSVEGINKRFGKEVFQKYIDVMGKDIVDVREREKGGQEVRLRTFAECKKQFDRPETFLLMAGEEISDEVDGMPLHMNATNLKEVLMPTGGISIREAMRANLRAAKLQSSRLNREILVHLNHPNFGYAITAEDLAAVTEERFYEVYNGHPAVNHLGDEEHPSVERIWDIANTIRIGTLKAPPLLGLATDDCHHYHDQKGSVPGRGWIMVKSDSLTTGSILKSINAGEFYASSGVELANFSFESSTGKLRIEIVAEKGVEYRTQFIGTLKSDIQSSGLDVKPETNKSKTYSAKIGKTLGTETGNTAEYQMTGEEVYVRAVVSSSKEPPNASFEAQVEQAWIQPVVWQK